MTELERIRAIQPMIFGSLAGAAIREIFVEVGHLGKTLETDAQRIEYNLVRKLMKAYGVNINFVPTALPDDEPGERNLIDMSLEGDQR